MRQFKKIKVSAYLSVEAAVLVPCATFAIVLIIYFAFFVYARCILSQDVYLLGFRSMLFYESQGYGSPDEYVNDKADIQTGNRYFMSAKPTITASGNKKKITVEGETSINPRALFGYFNGIPDVFKSNALGSVKKHDPPKYLRRLKRIQDVAENLHRKGKNE